MWSAAKWKLQKILNVNVVILICEGGIQTCEVAPSKIVKTQNCELYQSAGFNITTMLWSLLSSSLYMLKTSEIAANMRSEKHEIWSLCYVDQNSIKNWNTKRRIYWSICYQSILVREPTQGMILQKAWMKKFGFACSHYTITGRGQLQNNQLNTILLYPIHKK